MCDNLSSGITNFVNIVLDQSTEENINKLIIKIMVNIFSGFDNMAELNRYMIELGYEGINVFNASYYDIDGLLSQLLNKTDNKSLRLIQLLVKLKEFIEKNKDIINTIRLLIDSKGNLNKEVIDNLNQLREMLRVVGKLIKESEDLKREYRAESDKFIKKKIYDRLKLKNKEIYIYYIEHKLKIDAPYINIINLMLKDKIFREKVEQFLSYGI
jgi:hypothetical protein